MLVWTNGTQYNTAKVHCNPTLHCIVQALHYKLPKYCILPYSALDLHAWTKLYTEIVS